jgi:hypothetical protein
MPYGLASPAQPNYVSFLPNNPGAMATGLTPQMLAQINAPPPGPIGGLGLGGGILGAGPGAGGGGGLLGAGAAPAWTRAQMAAGGRMEAPPPIPGQPMGIARNWVTPPRRDLLASMMARNLPSYGPSTRAGGEMRLQGGGIGGRTGEGGGRR